ncbi:MAG: tetratricopeptide repeat protein, partial [Balneolaceae bacterium]
LGNVFYEASDRRMTQLKAQYAYILRALDRLDEAEEIYREVILALTEPAITDSIIVASVTNNLGYLLRLKERYDEAIDYYQISLDVHEGLYGINHPRTVMINNNLAVVNDLAGRTGRAESLLLESLKRTKANQPDDHWRVGSGHAALARFYSKNEMFHQADSMFTVAHQLYTRALGEDHEWTTGILNERARTLIAMNRSDEIKPLLSRVIQLTEARYGTDHDNIRNASEIMTQFVID